MLSPARPSPTPLRPAVTATILFAIGFLVSLAGDAGHVASGTTTYLWDGVPSIWRSDLWFPFAVALPILAGAWLGRRLGLPATRVRSRSDATIGVAAVLALYAFTSTLRGEPETVSLVLCCAIAVAVWAWWDPSPWPAVFGLVAAVAGPALEIAVVELGGCAYAADADGLFGVAPWLMPLYFAAGAVSSGLWAAVSGERRAA